MKNLSLLAFSALLLTACHHDNGMDNYNGCGLEGDAKRTDVRDLNTQKNRYDFPDSASFDHAITLQAMLAPGDDKDRFRAGKAVEISGYMIDVKVGGDESCNCHARNPEDRDTHIEIVESDNAEEHHCVIVEITPRMRAIMANRGIDWNTDNIRKMFKGQYVKVKGWLLFDEEHSRQAENTAPDNPKDWRATCWEVHPVTSIELSEELKTKS